MHSPAHIQKASDSGSSRVRKRPVIQADLEVGKPGDKYEQEADAVAQRVMMQPSMDEEEAVQMQPAAEEEELQMQTVEEEELQMQGFGEEEELQMEQMDEEEEMLQMEEAEEEETLQMQVDDEEEMLQMQSDEKEEILQTKPVVQAIDGGGMKASPELASKISVTNGTGSPLEPGLQREMGGKIGADFSGVNIHSGHDAAAMSSEIGARAFTVGNDIYFNKGQYDPHSSSGKHLLAHELTHTVQQGGSNQTNKIQKDADDDNVAEQTLTTGIMDDNTNVVRFESLAVPPFKKEMSGYEGEITRPAGYTRTLELGAPQRDWKANTGTATNVKSKLREILGSESGGSQNIDEQSTYAFKTVGTAGINNKNRYVIGNLDESVREFASPTWNKNGTPRQFHVDHILELQLGGTHTPDNLHLLSAGINRSSGFAINRRIIGKVKSHLRAKGQEESNSNVNEILTNYDLIFNQAIGDGAPYQFQNFDPEKDWWQGSDIISGKHFDVPNIDQLIDVAAMGELGDSSEYFLFPGESGWIPKRFRNNPRVYAPERDWLKPWEITEKETQEEDGDEVLKSLSISLPERSVSGRSRIKYKEQPPQEYSLNKIEGAKFAGFIDRTSFRQRAIELRDLSPIRFDQLSFSEEGINAQGEVLPTIPLIQDVGIQLAIRNGELVLFKEFNSGELDFPSPFEISNCSLVLSASSESGLGIEGQVDFGINQVGEGHVGAAASTSGGFELEGAFNFDSELFNPAAIEVEYKDETWTIGGQIGIPEGKVRGVKSATINATYSEGNFAATGEAELDIPGIERGTMEVNYGEEGFSIGGAFDLSSDIPGIQSGRVEATVSKESGDEEYSVSVAGTAQPDIPGVDSTLSIAYNDGAITIEGTADYSRGMLSGTVRLGATNRAIDDNGQPEGEPDDTMRVYGGGSLTLQLTPWLEATAGVTFLPNGEMEVQGRIGLPGTVDVFPRRQIRRNLFTAPTIEIPLFAIPLGPRSIGLVAQIGGGLDFEAGFGPGQLRELYAEVTYNPDREDETTLHGRGVFAIPADAGLTLRGDLGLGVSVAIASLSGGIELAGTLGLEGEALASVDVNWSPQTGIALDAEGRVTVNPKFEFNLNAFARATLGIGWFSVSKTWRHRLAGFEWGPDIQFGIVFPVQYREGEPFDLSFDDIEVIYPELDIPNMAKGLARDVKDDLF